MKRELIQDDSQYGGPGLFGDYFLFMSSLEALRDSCDTALESEYDTKVKFFNLHNTPESSIEATSEPLGYRVCVCPMGVVVATLKGLGFMR
jgi:hypothetical protein